MSDLNSEHGSAPAGSGKPAGAFDWLLESHRQSAPMAPLEEEPAQPAPIALSEPSFVPEPRLVPEQTFVAPPAAPHPAPSPWPVPSPAAFSQAPPPLAAPSPPLQFAETPPSHFWDAPPGPPAPVPSADAPAMGVAALYPGPVHSEPPTPMPVASVAATSVPAGSLPPIELANPDPGPLHPFAAAPLAPGGFGLERRQARPRSANGPLDWISFVLAILAPPVGLLLGIGAVITEPRLKGYVTGLAKAAIGIGAALSLVLAVGLVAYAKVSHDQAAHNAIVASSKAYCAALKSNPSTLASDTFGWPSPGDTIPDSITSMQQYVSRWNSLVKIAPPGIRADTQKVASTAKSIVTSVQTTQTLDDSSDVAQMQNAVATTGINAWVTEYCN